MVSLPAVSCAIWVFSESISALLAETWPPLPAQLVKVARMATAKIAASDGRRNDDFFIFEMILKWLFVKFDGAKVRLPARHRVSEFGRMVVNSGNEPLHFLPELGGCLPGLLFEDVGEIGFFIVAQFEADF